MNMPIRYKYYDDEGLTTVRSYIREVQRTAESDQLEIEYEPPRRYDKQIDLIRALEDNGFDGVILDLRLDMKANEAENGQVERAKYHATTLAQEMRTLATEGKIRDLPIVLWSLDTRYERYYAPDETAHNLFDLTTVKSDLESESGARDMSEKLIALATGYDSLERILERNNKRKSFVHKLLGFDEKPGFLGYRIEGYFDNRSALAVHEYARFVIHKLLTETGPMVSEDILAARLGIDYKLSKDWRQLLDIIDSTRYCGPFKEGWRRWWWPMVEKWWAKKSSEHLRKLSADQRVKRLCERTGLDRLEKAEPIEEKYSARYWTVCSYYREPLSPSDGLRIKKQNIEPWMDRPFISKKAALLGKGRSRGLEIDPLDEARLARLRKES